MLHYIPRHNCEHLVSLMANLSNFSNSTYDMVFNTQVCLSNKKPNNFFIITALFKENGNSHCS